jgi:hypothetical protein
MKKLALTLLLASFSAIVVEGCSSSSEPDHPKIAVVLSSNVSGGESPFDVAFTLEVVGDIDGVRTHVPAYHFNSGQGRISDIVEYSTPDTSTAALRTYSWTGRYSVGPGVRLAVAYLKLLDRNVYSDTLRIVVD